MFSRNKLSRKRLADVMAYVEAGMEQTEPMGVRRAKMVLAQMPSRRLLVRTSFFPFPAEEGNDSFEEAEHVASFPAA